MHSDDRTSPPPSRRSVVKGAAWAAPVIVAAQGAPALAASQAPPLTFSGRACKLPGNSTSIFKGYVFELFASNVVGGAISGDAITVIDSITASGIRDVGDYAVVVRGAEPVCSCGPCDPNLFQQFCTPEGTLDQQVLIFTTSNVTGTSAAAVVTVTYRVYGCDDAACGTTSPPQTLSNLIAATPPSTPGGGSCPIVNITPLPG